MSPGMAGEGSILVIPLVAEAKYRHQSYGREVQLTLSLQRSQSTAGGGMAEGAAEEKQSMAKQGGQRAASSDKPAGASICPLCSSLRAGGTHPGGAPLVLPRTRPNQSID